MAWRAPRAFLALLSARTSAAQQLHLRSLGTAAGLSSPFFCPKVGGLVSVQWYLDQSLPGIPRQSFNPRAKFMVSSSVDSSVSQVTSTTASDLQEVPELPSTPADILDTDNAKLLYSGMTSAELVTTLINLTLVASEPLVDLSIKVLKSPLAKVFPVRNLCFWLVKRTTYVHFCAGENVEEASLKLERMWQLGLRGILDYSLEDAQNNQDCDKNLNGFLQTIFQVHLLPPASVSYACVKITAIAVLPLLERISDLLRWQHTREGFQLPWKEARLPVLARESPTFHVLSAPEPLTPEEEEDLALAEKRLWRLCEACQDKGLPLLVDAEYTSVQPAIDYLTFGAMLRFNRAGPPLVYGTIQAYLKDALPRLTIAFTAASDRGVSFGIKLVRGAYLSKENALAASLNAESPVHSSIEKTHRCYDACASFLLQRVSTGEAHVVLATHNFESGKAAARKADELGIARGNSRLQFAQLKGMADGLSLALANAGFQVSKYLPFGPVDQVLPYLIRRAEENRGVLGNTQSERDRIRAELKRRLYSALGAM